MRGDGSVDRRRRSVLLGGVGAIGALAGCISTSPDPPGQNQADDDGGTTSLLKAGGSSTVYPVVKGASAYWAANYPASDQEYWGPLQYDIQTSKRLADYWAGLYGFEPRDSGPPFQVTVSLSHSGTGLEKVKTGQLDVGNASAPASAEFPEMAQSELDRFTDHVVAVDAQPIVVSRAVYEAGVDELRTDQVRGIYRGDLSDWSEIPQYDGPSREIQAVGRTVGSGTDTAFRANLLGSPDAEMGGVDVRKGQNQQVATVVERSDNAIAYMALAFVSETTPAIALEFEGETYVPGENLSDPDYPLSRDLHCYTWEGTSKKEAAFLRMILSEFGQQRFVKPEGYAALTDERRQNQLDALPEPTA